MLIDVEFYRENRQRILAAATKVLHGKHQEWNLAHMLGELALSMVNNEEELIRAFTSAVEIKSAPTRWLLAEQFTVLLERNKISINISRWEELLSHYWPLVRVYFSVCEEEGTPREAMIREMIIEGLYNTLKWQDFCQFAEKLLFTARWQVGLTLLQALILYGTSEQLLNLSSELQLVHNNIFTRNPYDDNANPLPADYMPEEDRSALRNGLLEIDTAISARFNEDSKTRLK